MSDSESSSEDDLLAAMAALPPDMLSEPQRAAIILQVCSWIMDSSGTAGGGRGCVRSWTAGGGRGAAPVLSGCSRCMPSCRRAWPSTGGPIPLFDRSDRPPRSCPPHP